MIDWKPPTEKEEFICEAICGTIAILILVLILSFLPEIAASLKYLK